MNRTVTSPEDTPVNNPPFGDIVAFVSVDGSKLQVPDCDSLKDNCKVPSTQTSDPPTIDGIASIDIIFDEGQPSSVSKEILTF